MHIIINVAPFKGKMAMSTLEYVKKKDLDANL